MTLFLTGLALSIPLSILANLMTGRLQSTWAKRNEVARAKASANDTELAKMAVYFKKNMTEFSAYLLAESIRFVMIATCLLVSTVGSFAGWNAYVGDPGGAVQRKYIPAVLTVIAGIFGVLICVTTLMRIWRRVRDVFVLVRIAGRIPVNPGFTGLDDDWWQEFANTTAGQDDKESPKSATPAAQ